MNKLYINKIENNNDTCDFNQSQLYTTRNNHENNTECFFQELCERRYSLAYDYDNKIFQRMTAIFTQYTARMNDN